MTREKRGSTYKPVWTADCLISHPQVQNKSTRVSDKRCDVCGWCCSHYPHAKGALDFDESLLWIMQGIRARYQSGKSYVLAYCVDELLIITIGDNELEVVNQSAYFICTISSELNMDTEIEKSIGKEATTFSRLNIKTKMTVYNACVICTLLFGSETWTIYVDSRRQNTFHSRCIWYMMDNIVEVQSTQLWSSVSHRLKNHVHSHQTAQASISRYCSSFRSWPNSQRHPLRITCSAKNGISRSQFN